MRYVIGVDGGPTGTTAVIVDNCGNLLGVGLGGAASLDRDSTGAERLRRPLIEAITGAILMADLENARISAACISMSGDRDELECVLAPIVPADQISVGIHSHVALNTISLGAPGVVVLADISAEAYGVNGRHQSATTGGWGQVQGDDGSSYWLALRALNACCRAKDGVGANTQILPLLLQHFEADNLAHVFRRIHAGDMPRHEMVAMMDVIGGAAAQGDAIAKRLLREAGKELGMAACAILSQLEMTGDTVVVGTVGTVFRAGRLVLRAFREVVQSTAPHCRIIGPQAPICVGAAIEALIGLGVEFHEKTISSISKSLPIIQSSLPTPRPGYAS